MQNQTNYFLLQKVLIVVNAYGAFLKEREVVKRFNEKQKSSVLSINKEVKNNVKDYYDDYSSGLSANAALELTQSVDAEFAEIKEEMKESLIATEKYYKKLKHQFKEKYPLAEDMLEETLEEHRKTLQKHKKEMYNNNEYILNLSSSFVSFLRKSSGMADGAHIALYSFYRKKHEDIANNYDKQVWDGLVAKYEDLGLVPEKTRLTRKEIDFLGSVLNKMINVVSEEDLDGYQYVNQTTALKEEKVDERNQVATKILVDNFNKMQKLDKTYQGLKAVADKLF